MQLKEERKREEEKMENEFKKKLMEKFAEDERLEQYNVQKRRMKEMEFKKEVCLFKIYPLRLKNNGKKNLLNTSFRKNMN